MKTVAVTLAVHWGGRDDPCVDCVIAGSGIEYLVGVPRSISGSESWMLICVHY
jgi:hypothetical protein